MANYYGAPSPFSYPQYPQPQEYGSAEAYRPKVKRPSRLNLVAMCLCLFLPWMLFCTMYGVMSFSMHYDEKTLCYLSVLMGLIFVITIAKLALDSVTNKQRSEDSDASWFVFLAVTCVIAWLSGVMLGDLNYFYNTEPYYHVKTLNSYPSVDPSKTSGQQLMDAGRVTFTPGTRLDLSKAMAFRNLNTYCVAPAVAGAPGNTSSGALYDFWAVGLNCCSGRPGDFSCGEFNNPHALSGLRVMRDDQREFYQLAVRQAEATYNIKAKHPLFFYWMQDPIAEIAAYMDEGVKYFIMAMFTSFAVMLFLVVAAVVLFSKLS